MQARPVRTFTVLPRLPERLLSLHELAYNLWWCWHADAVALFRRIDPERFEQLDHSPIRLLTSTTQVRFDELANDDGFVAHLDRVWEAFQTYLSAPTWFADAHPDKADLKIAYFSAEFGIHESVPVYSGGLGVLAGDHLKSASDLGLPLMGVSLMYRQGYFRQYLNVDGWQQERYPENDFFNLPLIARLNPDGSPLTISVQLPGREAQPASGRSTSAASRYTCSTAISRRIRRKTATSRLSFMVAIRTHAFSRKLSLASAGFAPCGLSARSRPFAT